MGDVYSNSLVQEGLAWRLDQTLRVSLSWVLKPPWMDNMQHPCFPAPSTKIISYISVSRHSSNLVTRNISAANKAFPVLGARIRPSSYSCSLWWLLRSLLRAELMLRLFSPSHHLWESHTGSNLGCTLFSWNADEIHCHSHLYCLHLSAVSQTTKGHTHICTHIQTHSQMHVCKEIPTENNCDFFFNFHRISSLKLSTILFNF